jgi:hypothetical protein
MKCELLNERAEPVTDFKYRESVTQWEGGAWHKVKYLTNISAACYGSSDHPACCFMKEKFLYGEYILSEQLS